MTEFSAERCGDVWTSPAGEATDVVISSRVRLARNLAGFSFLRKAARDDRRQIVDVARQHLLQVELAPQMIWVDLAESSQLERQLLVERHLISKQHSKGDEPRAVAVSTPDERLSIMVNEEDHLRIQVMRGGLALEEAFERINDIDDRIEARLDYAFHPRFGYLTACPTNVGTGIRVSSMIHLPALAVTGEIDKVRRAARSTNLAVRGFYGEGSEAVGDIYQISNQTTLGKSERQILAEFSENILPKVIDYERHARRRLMNDRRTIIEDRVHRALGTLRNARLMNTDEALQLLSHVRLGTALDLIDQPTFGEVNHLMLLVQPAHLQRLHARSLDQARRRAARADLLRERLALGGSGRAETA